MSDYYKLEDGVVTPCDTLKEWCEWMSTADRQIERTAINDDVDVSTVFLGIDHRWTKDVGSPIIFETLVFGGEFDGNGGRYTSIDAAKQGHAIILAKVRQGK